MIYILIGIAIMLGLLLLLAYYLTDDFKEALLAWVVTIVIVFGVIAAFSLILYGRGAMSL